MNDFERIGKALADPDPGRANAALTMIYEVLRRLLPKVWRDLNPASAQDILQVTALATWRFAKKRAGLGQPSIPNEAYLRCVLVNQLKDHYRRTKLERERLVPLEDRAENVLDSVASESVPEHDSDDVMNAYNQLVDRGVKDLEPRYREGFLRNCRQLWDVATNAVEMSAVLDAEVGGSTDPKDRRRAQNRVLKRHSLTRRALGAALEVLVVEGVISYDDEIFYRMILCRLVRCQTRVPRSSKESL